MGYQIDVGDLPEGYIVLDAVVLMKVLDPDGNVVFREHMGVTLNCMEKYGMAHSLVDTMQERIQRSARPGD